MQSTEIDLTQWCQDYESSRFAMDKPCVRNGFKYATDSRAVIRVPTDEPDTDTGDKKFPDAAAIYDKYESIVCDQIWPESFPDCPTCGQSGYETHYECIVCHGEGTQECDLGHDHECEECDGEGCTPYRVHKDDKEVKVNCESKSCRIVFANDMFNRRLIMKANSLPRPIKWASCGDGEPLKVVAGDATVLIMPYEKRN